MMLEEACEKWSKVAFQTWSDKKDSSVQNKLQSIFKILKFKI